MKSRPLHTLTILLLIIFTVISLLFYFNGKKNYEITTHVHRIQSEYLSLEQQIIETISDELIISNLITDSYTFEEFNRLAELPFGIIVYQGDSAIIWTNNIITPVRANIIYNDSPLFISESNGKYIVIQHEFPGNVKVLGFFPVQFEYGIKNKYLSDVKTDGIVVPDQFIISGRATPGSYAINSVSGNPVFFISGESNTAATTVFNNWIYVSIIVSLLLLLGELFALTSALQRKSNPLAGIILFAGILSGLYILIDSILFHPLFSRLPLFDPQFYGSPGIANSTGDLLIKTILFFCFALYIARNFNYRPGNNFSRKGGFLFIPVVLLMMSLLAGKIFKSLIIDSSISFDIHNFFSLNYFSFIGFFCIAVSLLSYFLVALKMLDIVRRDNDSRKWFLISLFVSCAIWIIIEILQGHHPQYDALLFLTGFVLIRWFMQVRKVSILSMGGIILWLIYFSGYSAWVFDASLNKKDQENKKLFALKKSIEKDPITEYLFNEMVPDVSRLLTMQSENTPAGARLRPGVINQLRQEFQNNYFKKYITDLFVFDKDTLIVATTDANNFTRRSMIDAIENDGERTAAQNLFFIRDNAGAYYYLAEIPVKQDSSSELVTYMRMIPKKFSGESIYPELLIDDDLRTAESFQHFNYAIYSGHTLTEREGEYSYPLMDIFYLPKDAETKDILQNDYEHYVYKLNETKKVVVSEEAQSWFEPISIFSYLFFFYLLFLVIILLFDFIGRLMNRKVVFREWINTSLQNKIQTSVISLIIFAFIMMGVATIYYISDQYNDSHKQRLLNKIEAVQTNIDFLMNEARKKGNDRLTVQAQIKRIANRVSELSEIHDMDINLYTPGGDLINSSQPDIFDKGLLSKKMNALAFFKMSCDKETWYIQNERIGNLQFLSAYVPLLANDGETMFYLNLPYFATEQNLRAEISSFMVTLVNVYVLLLIVAGIIAFFVSKSITSPLATIAGKFKSIKLGINNEPIAWTHEDEIGLLVGEYNKMLNELEKSAELLARSERESAWRDMAKQVAHEIKNPLTPMRLSIQHLQRAMQTKAANLNELTLRVTATLLEQIDNLSHIASEFSNFAVMPKAINEDVELNDILANVASLFKENEVAEIQLMLPEEKIIIFADKNQLLRVFNNLVKNALQAIPSDRSGLVQIILEKTDHRAVVKVIDNGIGISDDKKEKVFVPNFTTKSSGMGIGLAMAKNIVESAGGYIWFESEVDKGSIFFVEFPLREN